MGEGAVGNGGAPMLVVGAWLGWGADVQTLLYVTFLRHVLCLILIESGAQEGMRGY